MVHHRFGRRACAVHTSDVVGHLEPLVPWAEEMDRPVQSAALTAWISVEADDDPEIEGHSWLVELEDEVGLLVHPDRDDIANLLGEQAGVDSVVQLDREVLVVSAPQLCADGVQAAVLLAIAAANARVHDPAAADQSDAATAGGDAAPATAPPAEPAPSADDDAESRLVTGDASCEGQPVQIWVNLDGILILPAGILPHGPLDPSENPKLQRARLTAARAARLAEHHAGRWIPYPYLGQLWIRRPGVFRRRWRARLTERNGTSIAVSWQGTRPHALMLWGYVVAKCGLGQVDGAP
jgi:hypothetical protein